MRMIRMSGLPLAAIVLTVIGAACSSSGPDPADPDVGAIVVDARLGQTFELGPGQTARVGSGGLLVSLRGVFSDSRCPTDVTCVWAGDAAMRIRAAVGRGEWVSMDLHTNLDPRTVQFGEYRITAVSVSPEPVSTSQIPGERYKVTLRVE